MRASTLLISTAVIVLHAMPAFSCYARTLEPRVMVARADLILRVTAIPEASPMPNTVLFSVQEVVKGRYEKRTISLQGSLTDHDEWNRQAPPYRSARATADASCFTNSYRKGGQFLLILKKSVPKPSTVVAERSYDGYTIAWSSGAAVNEQLHSAEDPWVQWVRQQVKGSK